MEFCSEIIRQVDIPESLPLIKNLSALTGSIILKDAVHIDNSLRVEGDLLWQGFFPDNRDGSKCLWEGAEYFQEELSVSNLKVREPFMIEPQVLSVSGEETTDNHYNLTFSVRWWEDEKRISEDEENFELELKEIDENFRETIEDFEKTGIEDNLHPEPKEIITPMAEPFKPNTTEICNDFRELRKKKDATKAAMAPMAETDDEEHATMLHDDIYAQCPPYCLRYYRAREGDSIESIAERFAVSIAKMRGINELDEVGSIQGRMVRIPQQN
ncbi:MAG: LysM peptidoglycan-binding domain-containing protein [Clostridiales bacterium]